MYFKVIVIYFQKLETSSIHLNMTVSIC